MKMPQIRCFAPFLVLSLVACGAGHSAKLDASSTTDVGHDAGKSDAAREPGHEPGSDAQISVDADAGTRDGAFLDGTVLDAAQVGADVGADAGLLDAGHDAGADDGGCTV